MTTNGITCLRCGARTRVIKTRRQPGVVRRRRACIQCGHRITTFERSHGVFLPPGSVSVPQLVKNIQQRGFAGCTTTESRKNPHEDANT